MRYYHMIIQRPGPARWGDTDGRREYISTKQGSAPAGWVCVAVCGYHDVKTEVNKNAKNA
jgi:hypothetical protein